MKIEDIRHEFKVIFVDENYLGSSDLYEPIADVGYQTQFYPTFESAVVAAKHSPAHVIVVNYSLNEVAADRFLNQVHRLSPETRIVLLINEMHAISSIMKVSVGEVFDYLTIPLVSSAELLLKIDRATEQVFLKFENEQLRKRRQNLAIVDSSLSNHTFIEGDLTENLKKLKDQFSELDELKDQDELIKKYIFQLASSCGSMPVLYLKYLPLQTSFVFSQSIWTPLANIKNLGFKLDSLSQIVDHPAKSRPLKEFMSQVYQISEYGCFLHYLNGQIKGLTIIFNKENPNEKYPGVELLHSFFEIFFARNDLLKEYHNRQDTDRETGLANKKSFEEKLELEISRARRIEMPVSLIKVQIDNYDSLSQKYGIENISLVVKAFGRSMKKNFRTIDVLSRTQDSEFCFLLPHTDLRNSLLKAEKMRRAFHQSQFPFMRIEDRMKLSLSIGVSEYPSLSSDSDSLKKSCDEALHQVVRNGGNRVAAWQAESGFKPDFRFTNLKSAE